MIVQSLTGEGSALASSPGNTAGIIFTTGYIVQR